MEKNITLFGLTNLLRPVSINDNMTEIIIDTYLYSGCGTCIEMCPQIFRLDSVTEKAELVSTEPEITDDVYLAAAFCPEKCIEIRE